MKCRSIEFCNFRNIGHEKISFSDGINVLWGKNAQGKSNILEGVYYFARGRSFRGVKDRELVRFGEAFAKLGMSCKRDTAQHETELEIIIPRDKSRKEVYREKARISGMAELIGSFRAVLFCPAHLLLVSGSPQNRRTFLDIAISQLSPSYISDLSRYNRLLLQRNAALKEAAKGERISAELWETFAEQIASAGAAVASRRFEYMSMLSCEMEALFEKMTKGAEVPSLSYVSHAIEGKSSDDDSSGGEAGASDSAALGKEELSPETLCKRLLADIEREIRYGATAWGIHKDDIRIKLNGRDARTYASQGQMRSLALTMKLAEGELSHKIGGEKPVILLDDVLSELDADRRAFVLNSLSDRQIIVTSCETSLFESVGDSVNLMRVESGAVLNG